MAGNHLGDLLVSGLRSLVDAMRGQPSLNSFDVASGRSSEFLHLLGGKPFSVVGAVRVGDVHQLLLKTLDVALLKTNLSLDHGALAGLAMRLPFGRNLLELVELDQRAVGAGSRNGNGTDCGGDGEAELGEGNHGEYKSVRKHWSVDDDNSFHFEVTSLPLYAIFLLSIPSFLLHALLPYLAISPGSPYPMSAFSPWRAA